jgi:hypothetical protein
MTTPLIVLAVLTVFGGLLNLPYLSGGRWPKRNHDAPGGLLADAGAVAGALHPSFELTTEGILSMPKTPVYLSPVVAGLSTAAGRRRADRWLPGLSRAAAHLQRTRPLAAHAHLVVEPCCRSTRST